MNINNQHIALGESRTIQIPVANLPSGTEINMFAHVFRSKIEGPTALIIGGVHGDEVNGIEIARRSVSEKFLNKLKVGSAIVVPLLNIYGFINFSRGFPDGKDVNRAFPGNKQGSLASRIAYVFTQHILPLADFAIDFHTGGKSIYNYPQARYTANDPESFKLAEQLNLPYQFKSGLISKSLRKTAFTKNIPMVVFEGGESLRIDEFSVSEGLRGLKNVLINRGMIDGTLSTIESIEFESKSWIRANRSGVMILHKKSGDSILKGDLLATITNPYNTYQAKVVARSSGVIFAHNNNPVINKGDALFHVGILK